MTLELPEKIAALVVVLLFLGSLCFHQPGKQQIFLPGSKSQPS